MTPEQVVEKMITEHLRPVRVSRSTRVAADERKDAEVRRRIEDIKEQRKLENELSL